MMEELRTIILLVSLIFVQGQPEESTDIVEGYTYQDLLYPTPSLKSKSSTETPSSGSWLSAFPRPCSCQSLTCGCCAGMSFNRLNMQRQYCSNITYNPNQFAIELDIFNNTDAIYMNHLSGRYPPPMCLPIPNLPILAELCVQIFNIVTSGTNVNMCMDWLARIQRAPVFVVHFDCMRMGSAGVALLKPHQVDEWLWQVDGTSEPYDSVVVESQSQADV